MVIIWLQEMREKSLASSLCDQVEIPVKKENSGEKEEKIQKGKKKSEGGVRGRQ